jgi:hypothetical protein
VFDDEQARKTVINLRDQFNSFQATATQRIEQNSRTTLDLQNQLEGLRQELARLRGTERSAAEHGSDAASRKGKNSIPPMSASRRSYM